MNFGGGLRRVRGLGQRPGQGAREFDLLPPARERGQTLFEQGLLARGQFAAHVLVDEVVLGGAYGLAVFRVPEVTLLDLRLLFFGQLAEQVVGD